MEQWKIVKGFEDYAVSDLGRVKRTVALERTKVGKVMTPWNNGSGYLRVNLHKDGKRHSLYVHILVATAFIPNPPGLPEVNHKKKKSDNRAISLEWRSSAGQALDVIQRNLRGQGIDFCKTLSKWRVRVSHKHIGYFSTLTEAKRARKTAVNSLPYVD